MILPPDAKIVTLSRLRRVTTRLLRGATAAADRVWSPRDWPLGDRDRPCILVRPASNDQETAVARGQAPAFNATGVLEIVAEAEAPALAQDQGAEDAEEAIEALYHQIVGTVVGAPELYQAGVQHFPFIREDYDFNAEGRQHYAAVKIQLGLEYYADPYSFRVADGPRLGGLDFRMTGYPNARTSVDLNPDD